MIRFVLNGADTSVEVPGTRRLLDVLREQCRATGTKEGCGEGECGTCTVLLDGTPVNACLVAAGQVAGREVVTVEGLGAMEHLAPLAKCFVEQGGAQCGICTPGMLIAAHALLRDKPAPTEAEVREAIAGNLCRCTGYQRIIDSILLAAEQMRAARASGGAS